MINLPATVKKIRACEGDAAAQLVFEHVLLVAIIDLAQDYCSDNMQDNCEVAGFVQFANAPLTGVELDFGDAIDMIEAKIKRGPA